MTGGRESPRWRCSPAYKLGAAGWGSCWDSWLTITPPSPYVFHKSIILKEVKVLCFDRLLQVFIPKDLHRTKIEQNRLSSGSPISTGRTVSGQEECRNTVFSTSKIAHPL